jgi:putative ABC transport system permease protein
MTVLSLIRRNLFYFRGVNLAVVAGIATATAVLSGALMVGDSVRLSLRDLAVARLGKIDEAILGQIFFDASLSQRLAADPKLAGRFEFNPAIIEHGSAAAGSERAAGVQIIGEGAGWAGVDPGNCVVNSEVAHSLDLHGTGSETVTLSLPSEGDVPTDAVLAHRSRQDTISGLRVKVFRIESEPGMVSLFTSAGGQRVPQNVWVNLGDLQDATEQPGRANTLFVHDKTPSAGAMDELGQALKRDVTLSDYGLTLQPMGNGELVLASRAIYLSPPIEQAADKTGISLRKISVNLINAAQRILPDGSAGAAIHYAVAAGISPMYDAPLADDEAAINQWTADQLGAKVGDRLALTFYARKRDGSLAETTDAAAGFVKHFRIARILPTSGIGADASLTPDYKGLSDAASIAEWNPPAGIVIDQKLVTKADEAYWKAHRAAPKIFLNFAAAQQLWGTSIGTATSIRLPVTDAQTFETRLLDKLDPASMGMAFRPLRQEQLAAADGSVDFGQLFLSFSFFLIIAAALLAAMLMRLAVEQRARQLGVMAAVGFSESLLKRIVMAEQMTLAAIGGIVGSFAAIAYTDLLMAALGSWWFGAVGTTALRPHVELLTLVYGSVGGLAVAFCAVWWAVRQIGKTAPARLLAGGWETPLAKRRGGSVSRIVAIVCLVGGGAVIAAGAMGRMKAEDAFLAGGVLLLVCCLAFAGAALGPRRGSGSAELRSLSMLGIRNARRHTARSVLCIGLIALAAYALVTVSAMRQGEPTDTGEARSGSGGYRLMLQAQIPLLGNPATVLGRDLLGFRNPQDPRWEKATFIPMRRRAGQDVSCLNLTQPTNPAILGVPQEMIDRDGFTFASVPRGVKNPWELLNEDFNRDVIPIFADDSTAQYILHISPGQTIDVADGQGRVRHLLLVATLAGSIFQSELLMSDDHFRAFYPRLNGYGTVLIATRAADEQPIRSALGEELGEYGVTVRTTTSVLAGYLEVQNTYLSTFEALGGLGLMLGTIGLAVVLVRTVIERRSELALLASLGFSRWMRVKLMLSENIFLLLAGLAAGTVCAIVGVLPAMAQSQRGINFSSLAVTLCAALVCGVGASAVAVLLVGRQVAAADLRRE